jgi:hypothetical protein
VAEMEHEPQHIHWVVGEIKKWFIALDYQHRSKLKLKASIRESGRLEMTLLCDMLGHILGMDGDVKNQARKAMIFSVRQATASHEAGILVSELPLVIKKVCNVNIDQYGAYLLALMLPPADSEDHHRGALVLVESTVDPPAVDTLAQVVPFGRQASHGYAETPHQKLVSITCQRDEQIVELRALNRNMTKRLGRMKKQLGEVTEQHDALVEQTRFRPGKRNVSIVGGYVLAWKRNIGHTSAEALIQIVAGDAAQGALKDKNIVTKYEINANIIQRLVSSDKYAEMHMALVEQVQESEAEVFARIAAFQPTPSSRLYKYENILYAGDATNQDALEHEKCHVGLVSTAVFNCLELLKCESLEIIAESHVPVLYTRSLCDVQLVKERIVK